MFQILRAANSPRLPRIVGTRVLFALGGLLTIWSTAALAAPTSFTNPAAITITDCPNPCPPSGQRASLYPSPIEVSGLTGVVERVSITINGLSHAFPADTDFLLVSPSGRKSVVMSDFGAGSPGINGVNVTLDDYAARPVPSTVTGNTGVPFVSGSYRPANSGTTDAFPSTAPASPYAYTLSAFNGDSPNGTWNLFIIDDANLDGGSISGGWTISFDVRPTPPAAGDVIISEFRTRGLGASPPASGGSADEFIELYNNTDASITLIDAVPGADPTSAGGAGWRLSAAQGAAESDFLLISQTQDASGPIAIAPRSYLLLATVPTAPSPAGNAYALGAYPTTELVAASGVPNIAINPASATLGFLADDGGLAVFTSATASAGQRLDAVGFAAISNADYKEGAGLGPTGGITTPSNHSWVRRALASGYPQDSGDNASDFVLVDTNGASLNGVAAVLGAPGPQRGHANTAFTTSSAPLHSLSGTLESAPVDPDQPYNAAPNQIRDLTAVTNGTNGTLKIRRRYTNQTGERLVSLRFRVIALSTRAGGTSAPGAADLRLLGSPVQTLTLSDSTTVSTRALTLQTPPAQATGGGLNSSVGVDSITPTAALADGASVVVEFNLGVETEGAYQFVVMAEGLPGDGIGGVSAVDTFPLTDLSISKTNGLTTVTAGSTVSYTITASNIGDAAATGATVTDTLPAGLSNASWTCVGTDGGSCTASGTGDISDTAVNLPIDASVTYTLTATLDVTATGTLTNSASIAAPAGAVEISTTDNSAADTDTIMPVTVPDAPTIVTARLVASSGPVALIVAPASNGGATISNYEYAFNGDTAFTALSPLDAASPLSLPVPAGLTVTSVRIRAVNIAGAGAESVSANVLPPPTPTPVPTPTPTPVPTPVPTLSPTATPVPTATPTSTPTAVPTATPTAVPSATPTPGASDSDDVAADIERRVPDLDGSGTGDGNGDGIMDALQSDVASLRTAADNRFVTLIAGTGLRMTGVTAQAVPGELPADVTAVAGAVALRLVDLLPGAAGQVELLLTAGSGAPFNGVLVRNRVTGAYVSVAFGAGTRGDDRERLSLALIDGGVLDADGAANGVLLLSLIPAVLPSQDNDGAPDRSEARTPSLGGDGRGDGNGDGVADALQGNVATMPLATGSGFLTLSTADALRLAVIEAINPPDGIDPTLDLPYAGLSFTATGLNPGATALFELYVPENSDINGLLKRNRDSGEYVDIVDSVRQLPGQATLLRFRIADGGPFDADGQANGTIVDPVFPAVIDGKTPQPVSGRSGGGIGPHDLLLLSLLWMIGLLVAGPVRLRRTQ